MLVSVIVCVDMRVVAKGRHWVFLQSPFTLCLKWGLSLNWQLAMLARRADQSAPRNLLLSPTFPFSQCWGFPWELPYLTFSCRHWESISGHHACATSIVTESPVLVLVIFIFAFIKHSEAMCCVRLGAGRRKNNQDGLDAQSQVCNRD